MSGIGEIQKDSSILLELLIKDRENNTVTPDFPPVAKIMHLDANGFQQVESVKLDARNNEEGYKKVFHIPSHWLPGDYQIDYNVTINKKKHTINELFHVLEDQPLSFFENKEEEEDLLSDIDDYMISSDLQVSSSLKVEGNKILLNLKDPPQYNQTYMVVLDRSIKSISGEMLDSSKSLVFTSEYKPLLATSLEVRSILKSLSAFFDLHDIYIAIRDASQKAMQLLGHNPDPNNSRYRDIRGNDTALFPAGKYVALEASRILLSRLLINLINGSPEEKEKFGVIVGSGGSVQLGDFMVQDKTGLSGDSSGAKEESPLQKIQVLSAEIERDLKFWQDAMMGHNKRGYAKPGTASFRSDAGQPEGRDF